MTNVNVKVGSAGFTPAQQAQGNPASMNTKRRGSIPSQLGQCIANQEVLRSIIDDPDSKPLEVASCVRAWNETAERMRILRGKPLPGQLQPDGKHKVKRGSRRTIASITPESVAASMQVA